MAMLQCDPIVKDSSTTEIPNNLHPISYASKTLSEMGGRSHTRVATSKTRQIMMFLVGTAAYIGSKSLIC